MGTPLVSITMPHVNRSELLRRTLLSIKHQADKPSFEVIVVNDGDNDPKLESLCRQFKNDPDFGGEVRLFNSGRTYPYRGPAYPWNCSVVEACGEVIVLQSPECLHVGPVLRYVADSLKNPPDSAPQYLCLRCVELQQEDLAFLDANEADWTRSPEILRQFAWPLRVEYAGPHSHNADPLYFTAAMRREDYLKIGGLDERFVYLAYEDNFFLYLLKKAGFDIITPWDAGCYSLHQYHAKPSSHLDSTHAQVTGSMNRLMHSLIGAIDRGQAAPVANPGMPFGRLPERCEVAL